MAANSFKNPQNDYGHKQQDVKPSYRFSKIVQQTGGTAHTIPASTSESIFEIPPRCWNPNRSSVKFDLFFANKNTMYNRQYAHIAAGIDGVQLYTRGGVFICDIQNFAQYANIAQKTVSKDSLSYASVTSLQPGSKASKTIAENLRPGNTFANTHEEPQYFFTAGAVGTNTGDLAGQVTVSYNIPLSIFRDSLLAMDKDIYLNEVILLKIRWANQTKWGMRGTDAANPVADAENYDVDLTMSKLYLYLALEENPLICASLIEKVAGGGMALSIPYVHSFKNVPGAAGAGGIQNVAIRLNGAMGQHLKRVYHALYPADETVVNAQFLIDNTNKTNFRYYHTTIDNMRRQEFNVTTADNDDWDQVKHLLKGTPIDNIDAYRYNWFVADDFDVIGSQLMSDSEFVSTGLPLDVEHKWDVSISCANVAYNHYTFAVVSRTLMITNQGILLQ